MTTPLRCQRGTVSMMMTIAAIPLIGMVGLGTEAGSWYLIQHRAQNAADAAAMGGALALLQGKNADTAGQAYATQDGFTQGSSFGAGATQAVSVTSTSTQVTATITQYQPPLFSALFLGGANVAISAKAVAQINPTKDCAVGTGTNGVTIGGSVTFNGGSCSIASNTTFSFSGGASTFNGTGWSLSATEGCGSQHCYPTESGGAAIPTNYSSLPQPVPPALSSLESSCPSEGNCTLHSGAWPNLNVNSPQTLASGTYFYHSLTIGSKGALTGNGVTLVIGSGGLSMNGNASLTITAPSASGVAIYDTESRAVTFNGNNTLTIGGAIFFPNADVTWSGNNSSPLNGGSGGNCTVLIAKSLTFTGSAGLDLSGCGSAPGIVPQYASLVQ